MSPHKMNEHVVSRLLLQLRYLELGQYCKLIKTLVCSSRESGHINILKHCILDFKYNIQSELLYAQNINCLIHKTVFLLSLLVKSGSSTFSFKYGFICPVCTAP